MMRDETAYLLRSEANAAHLRRSTEQLGAVDAEITAICDDVLNHWAGHISTHYDGCWKRHAACLASLIRDHVGDDDDG